MQADATPGMKEHPEGGAGAVQAQPSAKRRERKRIADPSFSSGARLGPRQVLALGPRGEGQGNSDLPLKIASASAVSRLQNPWEISASSCPGAQPA